MSYLECIWNQCIDVCTQNKFPPRCHSNRPDSSEDTLENSSVRSSPGMDSLMKGNKFKLITKYMYSNFAKKKQENTFINWRFPKVENYTISCIMYYVCDVKGSVTFSFIVPSFFNYNISNLNSHLSVNIVPYSSWIKYSIFYYLLHSCRMMYKEEKESIWKDRSEICSTFFLI